MSAQISTAALERIRNDEHSPAVPAAPAAGREAGALPRPRAQPSRSHGRRRSGSASPSPTPTRSACRTGRRSSTTSINRRPDALRALLRAVAGHGGGDARAAIPLYTLESYRPVRDFDIVGISLQSELNYVNVPYLLDLAGIPRSRGDRGRARAAGGRRRTLHRQPRAGRRLLRRAPDRRRRGCARRAPRRRVAHAPPAARRAARSCCALAAIPGLYVPQLYRCSRRRRHAARLDDDAAGAPERVCACSSSSSIRRRHRRPPLVPAVEVVQDRLGMEVMRGCTQGCRFCQAGYWYRPVREHDPEDALGR